MAVLQERVISTRTLDSDLEVGSRVREVPRGLSWSSLPTGGSEPDLAWTNTLGFVGLDCFGFSELIVDGLNQAGLSVATLWMPATSPPRDPPAPGGVPGIAFANLASWLLGTCSTAADAREALQTVHIANPSVASQWPREVPVPEHLAPLLGWTFTGLLSLHDASGQDLVVDVADGQLLMTDVHYAAVGMTARQQAPKLSMVMTPVANSRDAANHAFHVLARLSLPRGYAKTQDYTQWSVVRDHSNLVYYVRTYDSWSTATHELSTLPLDQPDPTSSSPLPPTAAARDSRSMSVQDDSSDPNVNLEALVMRTGGCPSLRSLEPAEEART